MCRDMRRRGALAATLCTTAALAGSVLTTAPAQAHRANQCQSYWMGVRDFWIEEADIYSALWDIESMRVALDYAAEAGSNALSC